MLNKNILEAGKQGPLSAIQNTAEKLIQLNNYTQYGYNCKNSDFLGEPIFDLTFSQGQTVPWGYDGDKIRLVPDQVTAQSDPQLYTSSSSLLLEDEADYDRAFSVSIAAEYSGVSFSGSIQSSFMYTGNLFTSESSFYCLDFLSQTVLRFKRQSDEVKDSLSPAFKSAVAALPSTIATSEDKEAYFDFFDTYGTHYVLEGEIGGLTVMETKIQDSLLKSNTSIEVKAAVSAGYNGIVRSGSLDVETAYKSSTFLQQHKESIDISLTAMGGIYTPGESIKDWNKTIFSYPSLLFRNPTQGRKLTDLACISNLIVDAGGTQAIADNIISLVYEYNELGEWKDGLLSSPKEIGLREVKQAVSGAGFVISRICVAQNGDRGYMNANSGNSIPSLSIKGLASQHFYSDSDIWVPCASMTMPVSENAYYSTSETPTSGNPLAVSKFMGFGEVGDKPMLGDWTSLTLNQFKNAPSDGFVVGTVDWNGCDGARGFIEGIRQNGDGTTTVLASSSQHYYTGGDRYVPTNSFCMPVRSGEVYKVMGTTTCGTPKFSAYFIPMTDALTFFDDFQDRKPNMLYQAKSDGFLLAFLGVPVGSNGPRGYVDLFSHHDSSELESLGLMASASVHFYTGSDVWVPTNTAMIPVSKNSYYKANLVATSGTLNLGLRWIPLGINND